MNNQEIYDAVKYGLMAQGAFSINKSSCRYRNAKGHKCAAGLLIKDEHYNKALEECATGTLSVRSSLIRSGVSRRNLKLIGFLQAAHDDSASETLSPYNGFIAWAARMTAVAKNYRLVA